jgi:spore coat polysaccharide biosynthesis protein SpsF
MGQHHLVAVRNPMKIVFIVQARMTSTRLPGKVLMDLAGRPMLAQQIRRLRRCRMAHEIVIATTTNAADDPVTELAARERVHCFRGNEADVLSRYAGAARETGAEAIVRLTADCPLIDPETTDRVVQELLDHATECDYSANILHRTYPRGLDTEVFWRDTLERIDRMARSPAAREHVTVFARSERPDLFLCRSVTDEQDNSDLRWTVDTREDFELVSALYRSLDLDQNAAPYAAILAYVRAHAELARLNSGIETWDPHAQPAHSR